VNQWQVELVYITQAGRRARMLSVPMGYTDAKGWLESYERRGYRGRLVEIVTKKREKWAP
jgi:hypothetical protein